MNPRSAGRRATGDRGAEAVEFAVIVPVLLALLFGLISFGLLFFSQISLEQAAREGARLAAICNQDSACLSGVPARVQSRAPNIAIDSSQITVTPCPAGDPTASATVTVAYKYKLGIPPFAAGITLRGKASTPCGG